MMTFLHFLDIALWLIMACSAGYVVFFAIVSMLPKKKQPAPVKSANSTFLVIYPAYKEDFVIRKSVESFLQQTYSKDNYQLCVISDHMQPETNAWLEAQPITLLTPTFDKSSKAQALRYAIKQTGQERHYDYVVILDADNIVANDFLQRLNDEYTSQGFRAIQCHRTAKNANNDIAELDSLSEEVNNCIFRSAHNRIGLSSALIGSGMCFDYAWFCANVDRLSSAVEDRELEAMLMKQDIFIKYAENLYVLDEKVSNAEAFQKQRMRWMNGQLQALFSMMPYLPKALLKGNINYIDKTLQQALIPRSILLVVMPFIALLLLLTIPAWSIKWWLLFVAFVLAFIIAMPRQMRSVRLFSKITNLPSLVWRMIQNLAKLDRNNKDFTHTSHEA
jgi:cellulose synthase/poly-beta-1,6-N-acetylglucosamine synthase-like glycosyltransferase